MAVTEPAASYIGLDLELQKQKQKRNKKIDCDWLLSGNKILSKLVLIPGSWTVEPPALKSTRHYVCRKRAVCSAPLARLKPPKQGKKRKETWKVGGGNERSRHGEQKKKTTHFIIFPVFAVLDAT